MKNKFTSISNYFKDTFYLDYRSLALFRFLIGLVLVWDILYMGQKYIDFFFTDLGPLPRNIFLTEFAHPWTWSVLFFSSAQWFTYLFFVLFCTVCLLFSLGYKTRTMTLLLWIGIVSIHNRNWSGLNGGDDLVRSMFLILLFIPLNRATSVDRALNTSKNSEYRHYSLWNLTFYFQLALMYIASAILKDSPIWYKEYSALHYGLHLDIFIRDFGIWFRQFKEVLTILTFCAIYLELYGPLLIFLTPLSKKKEFIRIFLCFAFISFHVGILIMLNIGTFPYIAICFWTAMLPSSVWDYWLPKLFKPNHQKFQINYDANCGFCYKSVLLLKEFLFLNQAQISAAQDQPSIEQAMKKENSWIIIAENKKMYTQFDAFIFMVGQSTVFSFLAKIINFSLFSKMGHATYRLIAQNRKLMSSFSKHLHIENKPIAKKSLVIELFALLSIWHLSYWPLTEIKLWKKPSILETTNRWLHTYQSWALFAPYPKKNNVWFRAIGKLDNDQNINLISRNFDVSEQWPQNMNHQFRDKSFRKFIMRVELDEKYRSLYAHYLCRDWNIQKNGFTSGKLTKVEIFMHSINNLDNYQYSEIKKILLFSYNCE